VTGLRLRIIYTPYTLTPTKIRTPSPISTVPNTRSIHVLVRRQQRDEDAGEEDRDLGCRG
jgi:hypothetical protein